LKTAIIFMTDKSNGSQPPPTNTNKEPVNIVVKPGGEQPGTRAIINKADSKK
jgi:hypothetical protein